MADEVNDQEERTGLYIVEPDIVATLKNGPLWLKIFAAPSNKADLVAHIEDDEDDDHKAEGDDDGKDVGSRDQQGPRHHAWLRHADLDLAVGISSEEEFNDERHAAIRQGSYAVSADLGVEVGPARLDVSFVQGLKNDEDRT